MAGFGSPLSQPVQFNTLATELTLILIRLSCLLISYKQPIPYLWRLIRNQQFINCV